MLELVANTAGDADLTKVIGPYGALVLALAVIAWLVKDRARIIADRDAERAAKDALHDKLLEQSRELVPIAVNLGEITQAAIAVLAREQGR